MIVTYVPEGLYWLFRCRDILKEEGCYSNAGCAVIFSSFENEISQWLQENKWKISYALGVVTPPEHDPVAHAWLEAESSNGKKYWWDLTCQKNSPTWGMRSREFVYEIAKIMDSEELKEWFQMKYHGAEFSPHGVPLQDCRFPIIDLDGTIS